MLISYTYTCLIELLNANFLFWKRYLKLATQKNSICDILLTKKKMTKLNSWYIFINYQYQNPSHMHIFWKQKWLNWTAGIFAFLYFCTFIQLNCKTPNSYPKNLKGSYLNKLNILYVILSKNENINSWYFSFYYFCFCIYCLSSIEISDICSIELLNTNFLSWKI